MLVLQLATLSWSPPYPGDQTAKQNPSADRLDMLASGKPRAKRPPGQFCTPERISLGPAPNKDCRQQSAMNNIVTCIESGQSLSTVRTRKIVIKVAMVST